MPSVHIGLPCERSIYTVTVLEVVSKDTDFGPIGIHTLSTPEGNILVWTASGHAKWLEVGKTYTVKATVKTHDTSEQGVKRTIVTYVCEYQEPTRTPRVAVGLTRRRGK